MDIHTYSELEVSFHYTDKHVNKIEDQHMQSIDKLLEYLKLPAEDDHKYRDLHLARAIVVWMSLMTGRKKAGICKEVRDLADGYAPVTFSTFCEKYEIENRMIFGKGKDLNYVPGGTYFDMIPQASWNSFRCNNVWHLVYTELAIATVHGFHRGGEVLLEEDGDKKFYQSVATRGHTKAEFNDFWFCTNPYILAIHALPEDKNLQYLSADQAFDEEKFEQCAYLQPGFFMADLTLLTEDRWVLQSKRGRCTITVGCEETILKGLQFKYKLAFILESGELTEENITAMPRMVVYAPGMDEVTFTISLPVKGEYKFSTFVTSSEMERYVECFVFRIYCDEPDMHCRSIPKVVEEIGVGYTHVAKEFGLKNPSKATPTINVQNGTSKRTLQIADDKIDELEFSSEFVGTDVEIGYSEVKVDHQKGTLEVKAGLKREGECVLVIKGRDKLKRERFKPILNYIVSSYDNDEDDHEKLVRKNKKEVRKKSKSACKQKEVTTLLDRLRQIEKEVEYLNGWKICSRLSPVRETGPFKSIS